MKGWAESNTREEVVAIDRCLIAAKQLKKSRRVIALTGAGISVESGIPDFRSANGLWSRYDPMDFGDINSFRESPAKVWNMLSEMDDMVLRAVPNPAHFALAEMERQGLLSLVITQNIDSLHQRAGSERVIEYHGHTRSLRCEQCNKEFRRDEISLHVLPPLCDCGYALRPEIVFFGEEIPDDALVDAYKAACACDLMLIIGTSATVAPASYLPRRAKERGAFLVEINTATTEMTNRITDLYIAGPAGKVLPAILAATNHQRK